MNAESMKESEDPESTRDLRVIFGRVSDVKEIVSESGFERADALRMRNSAQGSSTQSSCHAESRGLLSLFSSLSWWTQTCLVRSLTLGLWMKPRWTLDSLWRHVRRYRKRGRACYQVGAVSPGESVFRLYRVWKTDREWGPSSVRKWNPCPG